MFFDNVKVNDANHSIKKNRLELLNLLCKSFDNFFTKCVRTLSIGTLSVDRFFGRRNGTSAPYFLLIAAILGSSVDT